MDIQELKIFLKVAQLKNFTQASKELGYSQSNVSVRVQQLEQEIGGPLFNRIGRSVSLTQYGEALVPYARKMIELSSEMENLLKSEASLVGTVKIGMCESLFAKIREEAFLNFHRRFPRVKLEFVVDATANLRARIEKDSLDLACLIDDPLDDMSWQRLYAKETTAVIIAGSGHPLSKLQEQRPLEPADLSGCNCVFMEEDAPYMLQFNHIMAINHVRLEHFMKLQNADSACRMAESGSFVSLLPYYTVADSVASGTIKILDLPEVKIPQEIQIILHKDKIITPQVKGLAEELQKQLEKI